MMATHERRSAERSGRVWECAAALYFICLGYRLLGWRVKTPLGEIDLIVRRGRSTVFVEVKAHRSWIDGANAVSRRKAERIVAAAHCWMGGRPARTNEDYRFDILLMSAYHWPKHLPNAFGLELW